MERFQWLQHLTDSLWQPTLSTPGTCRLHDSITTFQWTPGQTMVHGPIMWEILWHQGWTIVRNVRMAPRWQRRRCFHWPEWDPWEAHVAPQCHKATSHKAHASSCNAENSHGWRQALERNIRNCLVFTLSGNKSESWNQSFAFLNFQGPSTTKQQQATAQCTFLYRLDRLGSSQSSP